MAFDARALGRVFDDAAGGVRAKIASMYVLLLGGNVVAWVLAFAAFSSRPVLLGTAVLAYTFGLRHAVDADHISAIDNVTRKLMREGKRPIAVGLFFSLGHSTVVLALSIAIALGASFVKTAMPNLQSVGGMIGTSVSALFLFAIAVLNVVVFLDVFATYRRVRKGEAYDDECVTSSLERRGLLSRILRPFVRAITKSWHMYPLGLLFGLGFDTATEIGVLGVAAIEAGRGLPVYDILIFPLLFTAGMSLLDTTDGILMLGAYGWAYVEPMRKLTYNMIVTAVSVAVALVVGTIEVFGIGGDYFGIIGSAIVAVFALAWGVSALSARRRHLPVMVSLSNQSEHRGGPSTSSG